MGAALGSRRHNRVSVGSIEPAENIGPLQLQDKLSEEEITTKSDAIRDDQPHSSTNTSPIELNIAAKTARQLHDLLAQIEKGETVNKENMIYTLSNAANLLTSIAKVTPPCSLNGDAMSYNDTQLHTLVKDDEVRQWLTSTFSHIDSKLYETPSHARRRFRAVVDTIIVGQYFEKIWEQQHHLVYPPGVYELLQSGLDSWDFDIFELEKLTVIHPLKYAAYELFKCYDLLNEFKIPSTTFEAFLSRVEEGYKLHNNPYHNSTHGADVLQTVHYFIKSSGLDTWLSKLEILSLLFAATIHDIEHTGTTNSFHIHSYSELTLCYNDRSVLENYHLFRAFSLLQEEALNIFKNIKPDEFHKLRGMVVEMVLATDMSKHFGQQKHLKKILSSTDSWNQFQKQERPALLCQMIHIADISHPAKDYNLHHRWTERLMEEFFMQGDREKKLNIPCSPLCDRNTTAIPESQTGFIDFILQPSFDVLSEVLELIIENIAPEREKRNIRVWNLHLIENWKRWDKQSKSEKDDQTCSSVIKTRKTSETKEVITISTIVKTCEHEKTQQHIQCTHQVNTQEEETVIHEEIAESDSR